MANDPLQAYTRLQKGFAGDVRGADNRALLTECVHASLKQLRDLDRVKLKSRVPGKTYFAFTGKKKSSRAVNTALFVPEQKAWDVFCNALEKNTLDRLSPEAITGTVYSAAISFCCFVDLNKDGDQKTPGTLYHRSSFRLATWGEPYKQTTRPESRHGNNPAHGLCLQLGQR